MFLTFSLENVIDFSCENYLTNQMTDDFMVVDVLTADGSQWNPSTTYTISDEELCDSCRAPPPAPPPSSEPEIPINPAPPEPQIEAPITPVIPEPQPEPSLGNGTALALISIGIVACIGLEIRARR